MWLPTESTFIRKVVDHCTEAYKIDRSRIAVYGAQASGAMIPSIAIAPRLVDPGFEERLAAQLERLSGHGVYIPGRSKGAAHAKAETGGVSIPRAVHGRLASLRG